MKKLRQLLPVRSRDHNFHAQYKNRILLWNDLYGKSVEMFIFENNTINNKKKGKGTD